MAEVQESLSGPLRPGPPFRTHSWGLQSNAKPAPPWEGLLESLLSFGGWPAPPPYCLLGEAADSPDFHHLALLPLPRPAGPLWTVGCEGGQVHSQPCPPEKVTVQRGNPAHPTCFSFVFTGNGFSESGFTLFGCSHEDNTEPRVNHQALQAFRSVEGRTNFPDSIRLL